MGLRSGFVFFGFFLVLRFSGLGIHVCMGFSICFACLILVKSVFGFWPRLLCKPGLVVFRDLCSLSVLIRCKKCL